MRVGFTIWFTGLPGSGKSTLARAVCDALAGEGRPAGVLDGDEMRRTLSPELGFSEADRHTNVRRIGIVAGLLARHGVVAIVAAVSPYEATRREVRFLHTTPFLEVFLDCPLPELQRRDPKGLYAKALRGEIQEFTGISAPYERPSRPDLHLRTDQVSIANSAAAVLAAVRERQL